MHDPGWRMLAEDIKHLPARTIDEALRKQAFAIPSAPFIKYTDDNIHFDTYTYSSKFPAPLIRRSHADIKPLQL